MPEDLYDILGVDRDAGTEQIRRAYRRQAKKSHPDASGTAESSERFREVERAYETLRDKRKRSEYDREMRQAVRRSEARPSQPSRDVRPTVEPFAPGRPLWDLVDDWVFGLPAGEPVLEVLLSDEEARRGVTLPVEVPTSFACPHCRDAWPWERLACPACGGAGTVRSLRPLRLEIPPGVRHGERFRCEIRGSAPQSASFVVRVLVQSAWG